MNAIDTGRIDAMVAQLRAVASKATTGASPIGNANPLAGTEGTGKASFADVLKNSLDQVNGAQRTADQLGQRFAVGDDTVNLSDVMIATQKANIGLQATIQVRNKLVSAYHEIMNMQV
jgi:flagellar hook-basal body complex protein FliE